jgi:uncharacterized protein YcbK (DUF882 family)
MILRPGRTALSFAAPRAPGRAVISALLVPLLTGAVAERCYRSLLSPSVVAASASLSRATAASNAHPARTLGASSCPLPNSPRRPASTPSPNPHDRLSADATKPASAAMMLATTSPSAGPVVNVQSMLRTIAGHHKGGPTDAELAQVPTNGYLRLQALHLSEELNVRPFDDLFHPIPDALAQIDHALRCRVTGTEINIDRRLIGILVQLHTLYGRAIQLVSGHRQPATLGTKSTSQHALGRAADIRIPGVGIQELERVALKFGARGVGLYPEKGFVHVDVREKNRYRWIYTEAEGEQPDMGMAAPRPLQQTGADAPVRAPDSESEAEADEANGGGSPHRAAPVQPTRDALKAITEAPPAEMKAAPATTDGRPEAALE